MKNGEEFDRNEHGVPQYPKGHVGRLIVTLAAIDYLRTPTQTEIARYTGLSGSKIDDYVRQSVEQLGVSVTKENNVYHIHDWGELILKNGVKKSLTFPLNGIIINSSNNKCK